MSEQEKETAREVRREMPLTGAQLSLARTGIAMRREHTMLSSASADPKTHPDYKRLEDLTNHVRRESERRMGGDTEMAEMVSLSLEDLYLVFRGLEAYEQQMLGSKFEPLGEVRTLIETLRREMIQREMDLGEIQAALYLTPMGKAIMAQIPPDQLFW